MGSFNLIDQPWIPVYLNHAGRDELSIRSVFHRAREIETIGGELPTQAFAIQRLLIAIMYRGINWGTAPDESWSKVWNEGCLPQESINAYLDRYHERFDILHPATPFYQVADLNTAKSEFKAVEHLIADIPSNTKYFTTRSGVTAQCLSFAEASRWLVHCQAFDLSGIKSGDPRDQRVKGGKGYPIGTAWAGQLGGVLFEGVTEFETLMLNTVLVRKDGEALPDDDAPLWEREPHGPTPRTLSEPLGPTDLLTWQSRRIRLQHNSTAITGALICNGDPSNSHNKFDSEFWTGWRYSEPQSKKFGESRYLPRQHDPDRALWRGINALLADVDNPAGRQQKSKAPGVSSWISYLMAQDYISEDTVIRPHATGLQYINNASVIGESFDDSVQIRAALAGRNSQARRTANRAVTIADEAVTALANLAGNLAEAAGGPKDGPRDSARSRAFFALDAPYRHQLKDLTEHTDFQEYLVQWQRQVRRIVTTMGSELIDNAGIPAQVGRVVDDRYLDSSLAAKWFGSALRKALPDAFDNATELERPA